MHRRVFQAMLVACALVPARAQAQALIPHQMHRSATFELHSIHDDVQLYEGDPQHLLRLEVRPELSLLPKIDFYNANQVVVLRIRDLSTLEPAEVDSVREAENIELGIEEDPEARQLVAQGWKIELAPAAPTDFILHCEGGKNLFDFTDLPVRMVQLLADTTVVRVEFNRPNPVPLDRFKLTARVSRLEMRGFGNARARSTTLQVPESNCEIDLGGKPNAGEVEFFIEGVPTRLRLTVPRDIGLHVEGPASTVSQFDRDGMMLAGQALEDRDYATRPSRVRLFFSQAIPKLDVRWGDAD